MNTHAGSSEVEHRHDRPEIAAPSRGRHVRGSIPAPRTDPAEKERDPHKGKLFRWGETMYAGERPYLRRWVFQTRWFSLRIHHFICSDDPRALHDHPWWFLTVVFKGGYTDVGVEGEDHLRAPAVRFRSATHKHTVRIDEGGAWTFVISGPKVRTWGFWVKDRFVKANKYFFTFGHHPCDE